MRITHEQIVHILDEMSVPTWRELGRLYHRSPLALRVHATRGRTLVALGLAEHAGRQHIEQTITMLGEYMWENYNPDLMDRKER